MTKKIVVVTSIPLDEPVILNRILPLIEQCRERGYDITLLGVDYSDIELSSKIKRDDLELVLYKSRYKSKHSILMIRLVRDVYIAFRLGKKLRTVVGKADVILVTIPSMFLPLFVTKTNELSRLCLDIRDLTWEYLIRGSALGKVLGNTVRRLLKSAIRKFDYVSVTNDSEQSYVVKQFGYVESAVYTVTNGVSQSQYSQLTAFCNIPRSFTDNCVISYVGNVGIAQTFHSLLECVSEPSNIHVNIVGSGARLDDIKRQVHEQRIDNVNLPGRVNWESVIDYYNSSDILFLSLDKGYESAIPSKLYEYLAIGKPIIFVGRILAQQQFTCFKGLYFCPDDPLTLKNIIGTIRKIGPLSLNDISWNRKLIKAHYIREKNWSIYLDKMFEGGSE